jgi:HK97 family phage major capsid protein
MVSVCEVLTKRTQFQKEEHRNKMNVEQIKTQIAQLNTECENLVAKQNFTKADKSSVDLKLAKIADLRGQLKTLTTTDAERRQRMRDLAVTIGPEALLSKEERNSVRSLLADTSGERETKTYRAMSVATDTAGGDFVPVSFYDKLTFALKAADALWDDSVITVVPTETGNSMTLPFVNDTGASASIITENTGGTEAEIATISRLLFGKTPSWRSGMLFASLELLQDSAFDVENAVIVPAVSKRFQRGIGAANVTTLLGSITSGVSSATAGTCKIDDVLALIQSLDAEYVSGPKSFIAMNFTTMLTLMRQISTIGSLIWKPRYDSNGRPMLGNLPVVICPSLPNIATGAKPVVVGDFSRCVRRQVQSVNVTRFGQAANTAEVGLTGYQAILRSDFGVQLSGDAPLKYLTVS